MTVFSKVGNHKLLWFVLAMALRMGLVLYGLWQDSNFAVKYTDIDYEVLTDGGRYVNEGGSPYERSTYRYTPLIAYMMMPNLWMTKIFGKLIFVFCDLVIGWLLIEVLKHLLKSRGETKEEEIESKAVECALFWLFNPIAMNVSTRGNAESVIGALVLLTLYLVVVKKSYVLGGIVYGLSIHVKIYPIVFCLALFFYIDSSPYTAWSVRKLSLKQKIRQGFKALFNSNRLLFTLFTCLTLVVLTGIFYMLYGWQFLYETYLYHLVRKDNRHNFSVFFYDIYLKAASGQMATSSTSSHQPYTSAQADQNPLLDLAFKILFDFGPQLALLFTISLYYFQDITFCVLIQTIAFVAFNKVCTVQYFCWYFSLLPLTLPWNITMPNHVKILLPTVWAATQGLWLYYAYQLEFLGLNTFYDIWLAGCAFFVANVGIIIALVWYHRVDPVQPLVKPSILVNERRREKLKNE